MTPYRKLHLCEHYLLGYSVPCAGWTAGAAVEHLMADMIVFGVLTLASGWSWWYVRLLRKELDRRRWLEEIRSR